MNLDEALGWADRSINTYFGEANFLTLSTQAGLLEKLGKKAKADSVMKKAFPMATRLQLYAYGTTLLRQNKNKEAFDVYKMNYDKYPDDIYTQVGMIKAYAAVGNTKEALKFAEKAMTLADDGNTRAMIEKMTTDLKAGKNINR
jgi:tetratricopeptide (TPR) repeat protein